MLKLFPLHQQHRVKNTSLNWFCGCRTTQRIRERNNIGRGIVGSEKGEEEGERSENMCWTVLFYVCLFVCFPCMWNLRKIISAMEYKG